MTVGPPLPGDNEIANLIELLKGQKRGCIYIEFAGAGKLPSLPKVHIAYRTGGRWQPWGEMAYKRCPALREHLMQLRFADEPIELS